MIQKDRFLRAVVLALLLYSLGCLLWQYRLLCRTEQLTEELAARHELLTEQNRGLAQQLKQTPDEREMRRLAWERLGMLAPEEKVFLFIQEDTDREDTVWDWKLEALWKDG